MACTDRIVMRGLSLRVSYLREVVLSYVISCLEWYSIRRSSINRLPDLRSSVTEARDDELTHG